MRLKSVFVGGLSLLMLGLFPTAVWASEEGRAVEMSVAAVKQYYRDRDYVSLFDALVFAGGEYTKVIRPSEIYFSRPVHSFGVLRHLEPILSKVEKVYLRGKLRGVPSKYVHAQKTSQEVLSSGGAIFHLVGMDDDRFEEELSLELAGTLTIFPKTKSYTDQLSSMFNELRRARKIISKFSQAGHFSERGWFSCAQMKIGHKLDGALSPFENARRLSVISAWSFGGEFPHPFETSRCRLQGFLSVVGIRGSVHSNFEALHVKENGEPTIGPELQCALDLLYHPQISDGMDREKALSVLTALSKEDLHCE